MPSTDIDRLVIYRRPDDMALLPLVSPTEVRGAGVSNSTVISSAFGFTFNFDGVAYTSIDISGSGFARLAGTVTSFTNSNLFASSVDVVLAPWWEVLRTAYTDGYIRTEQQGTAPFRRWICEWRSIYGTATALNCDKLTFQLVIYETRDKFEFRYGPRERTGTGGKAFSASVGYKGDTVSVTTNYRAAESDGLALGGYTASPRSNLTATDYDALTTICVEPAWPMCGRYIDIPTDQVTGIQSPYADPAWALANNVNWLYCNHRPAALAIAPWYPELTTTSVYMVPVPGQDDHYAGTDVLACLWTASTANVTLTIEPNLVSNPDPNNAGDWDVGLYTRTVSTTGRVTWTPDMMAGWDDPVAMTHLRITVTSSVNVKLESLLLIPTEIAEVPLGERLSGFQAQGLAQILQSGAAIHPEWYNRAWRNAALVLSARPQALWASVWPYLASASAGKFELLTSTGPNQFRVVGIAAGAMVGYRNQDVDVRVVVGAASASGSCIITVSEDSGAGVDVPVTTSIATTVTALGVRSDTPTILAVLSGSVTDCAPLAVMAYWTPALSTTDLIRGVTPGARLEHLVTLADRLRRASRTYALAGLATFLSRARSGTQDHVRLQWMVPPATSSLRPRVHRVIGRASKTTTSDPTSIYGASSGAGVPDEILVPSDLAGGGDEYTPEGAIGLSLGAMVYDATPAAATDRLLESPTAASWAGPARETVDMFRGVGAGLTPIYPPANSV